MDRASRSQGRRTEGASSASGGDSLSISEQARFAQELGRLLSAAQGSEDFRPGAVEEARADLESGALDNDAAVNGAANQIIDLLT